MIYSRNYARMFVTLKQEISDFSYDLREAMGRCVIEVRFGKGRFSAYIQGLKKGDYTIFFISCKNGNNIGVDIGKISADQNGKGEFKTEFDPENIYETNLKIEDFHVVAVMPFNCKSIKPLLTGYVGSVVQWKEGFSFFEKNTQNPNEYSEDNKNNAVENNTNENDINENDTNENNIGKNNTNENNTSENNTSENNTNKNNISESDAHIDNQGEKLFQENTEFFEKEYDITENVIKENKNTEINEDKNKDNKNDEKTDTENDKNTINIENLACVCEETEFTEISENKINNKNNISLNELQKTGNNFSDIIKKFKESIEKIEKERKNNLKKSKIIHIDDMKEKNYTRNLGLDYIFENNIKMSPFQKQKKDIVWVRIALSELVVLPGKIWIYLNNPFVAFSEKKYKHLILGKYFENKKEKYILGVPGVYLSNYRLEAGIQGFKQFKCCEDKRPSDGDYGYWLLKINV